MPPSPMAPRLGSTQHHQRGSVVGCVGARRTPPLPLPHSGAAGCVGAPSCSALPLLLPLLLPVALERCQFSKPQ